MPDENEHAQILAQSPITFSKFLQDYLPTGEVCALFNQERLLLNIDGVGIGSSGTKGSESDQGFK